MGYHGTMQENDEIFIFPCLRHHRVLLRKENYKNHESYHPEIAGKQGLGEIEQTLVDQSIITKHTIRDRRGRIVKRTQAFYRILGQRNTIRGESVIDYWKVVLVKSRGPIRWEIATAFINSRPRYAMFDKNIEEVIYQKNEN